MSSRVRCAGAYGRVPSAAAIADAVMPSIVVSLVLGGDVRRRGRGAMCAGRARVQTCWCLSDVLLLQSHTRSEDAREKVRGLYSWQSIIPRRKKRSLLPRRRPSPDDVVSNSFPRALQEEHLRPKLHSKRKTPGVIGHLSLHFTFLSRALYRKTRFVACLTVYFLPSVSPQSLPIP